MLQRIQNLFCAIWTECVWQIADAVNSAVKFIVSDHPVTVYNRGCPPLSDTCKGFGDPDIRMVASHTYFPLSMEKVLILTNLAWVRNPYQSETKFRPNPNFFRGAIFNYMAIQTHRSLSEEEVLQINSITKRRAYRYVAAAEREWLYPERRASSDHWRNLGDGYLLMPEPRDIHMGGEMLIGYKDGTSDAFSEYRHKPWQPGYEDKDRFRKESEALDRFQAEFAARQGPAWRGTSYNFGGQGPQVDSPEYHQHFLDRARALRKRKRPRYDLLQWRSLPAIRVCQRAGNAIGFNECRFGLVGPSETVGHIWNAGLTYVNALNLGALSCSLVGWLVARNGAGTQWRRESETRWET
jgi:hypothetical protein